MAQARQPLDPRQPGQAIEQAHGEAAGLPVARRDLGLRLRDLALLEQVMPQLTDRERALWTFLASGRGEAELRKLFGI